MRGSTARGLVACSLIFAATALVVGGCCEQGDTVHIGWNYVVHSGTGHDVPWGGELRSGVEGRDPGYLIVRVHPTGSAELDPNMMELFEGSTAVDVPTYQRLDRSDANNPDAACRFDWLVYDLNELGDGTFTVVWRGSTALPDHAVLNRPASPQEWEGEPALVFTLIRGPDE